MKKKVVLVIIAIAMACIFVPKMYEVYLTIPSYWDRIRDLNYFIGTYCAGFPIIGLLCVFGFRNYDFSKEVVFALFGFGIAAFLAILFVDMCFWDSCELDYAGDLIELHLLLGFASYSIMYLIYVLLNRRELEAERRYREDLENWEKFGKQEWIERQEQAKREAEREKENAIKREEKECPLKITYGTFTDSRDGNVYKTVKIGNQVWMAENLRYKGNRAEQGSFAYDDDPEMEKKYGRLYTWSAAMNIAPKYDEESVPFPIKKKMEQKNYRGIAPEGWHIPTKEEFETLLNYVRSNIKYPKDSRVSAALRLPGEWEAEKEGTNRFGFSVLPAGLRFCEDSQFYALGSTAAFWSSNADLLNINDGTSYYGKDGRLVIVPGNGVCISGSRKANAYSLRCLQD